MDWIKPETLSLSGEQLRLLSPYLTIFLTACIGILAATLPPKYKPGKTVSLISGFGFLFSAYFSIDLTLSPATSLFSGMMVSDPYAHFLNFLYSIMGGLVLLSAHHYLAEQKLRFA